MNTIYVSPGTEIDQSKLRVGSVCVSCQASSVTWTSGAIAASMRCLTEAGNAAEALHVFKTHGPSKPSIKPRPADWSLHALEAHPPDPSVCPQAS